MPPKSSNKKNATTTTLWYHCEKCNVHICAKDCNTHQNVCPIAADVFESPHGALEYVRENKFFTASVERRIFSNDELINMPRRYLQQLIFISEGVMRLAKFHIGQELVISAPEKPALVPIVRLAWPIAERFLTTICISEEDFQFYWKSFKRLSLQITPLPKGYAEPARSLFMTLLDIDGAQPELNSKQLRELEGFLALEFKRWIFTRGSLIMTDFFNKIHKLKVEGYMPLNMPTAVADDELALHFNKLNIYEQQEYFKITCATTVVVATKWPQLKQTEKVVAAQITKQQIGGLAPQLKIVEERIELALGLRAMRSCLRVSRSLLLYGPTGCGKTMICEAMCNFLQTHETNNKTLIIKIKVGEIFSKFLGETEKNLLDKFQTAYAHFPLPSLIVIEDIHNLCSKTDNSEVAKRVSAAFLSMLDDMHVRNDATRTFLLATTTQMDQLHPSIRRAGRLDSELEISAPSPQARREILECLLRNMPHELTQTDIEQLAQLTHAFNGADMAHLVYNAAVNNVDANGKMSAADLHAALTHVKPSAMREVLIENPNVHWTDIGGQEDLKLKLQQAIEWPLLHPEKFQRLGIKPPRGILMFGPPGCSKTMVAKALATESNLNFLSIKGPELFSMWVGESERAVRDVFRKARQVAPAIVFFDEIDAIGSERGDAGGAGSSVKERVLTQLLTELDGVEALDNVTIVAATNRPDMIDKALLRPGRIDRIIYVGLPDDNARRDILRIKLAAMPVCKDVEIEELVKRTIGYSGAELQAVCQEAALKTLENDLGAKQVTWPNFVYALKIVKPRTSPELLKLYEDYLKRH